MKRLLPTVFGAVLVVAVTLAQPVPAAPILIMARGGGSTGGGEEPPAEGRTQSELWPGTTRTAATCSTTDVQTQVTAAADGDIVQIPDGSCTWTSGITTTKQILIRAQNYTPTDEGTASRSVTITNNSAANLIVMQSGDTYHVGVAGIRFNEGTQTTNYLRFSGSGSKVPLVSDVYMEVASRTSEVGANTVAPLVMLSLGGVIWNMKAVGIGTHTLGQDTANGPAAGAVGLYVQSPRAWESASTLGDQDTDGSVNVYFEDSSAFNLSNWPDCEDQCRFVARNNDFDGTLGTGHGFTGTWGARHMEYYDNTFSVTDDNRPIARRYVWVRAGTVVTHGNVVNQADDTFWGTVHFMEFGEEGEIPGAYPYNRQPGGGWASGSYIIDPAYMYNESGAVAYTWGVQNDWEAHVVGGRDVFPSTSGGANPGTKPGYAPYTVPHPMRYTP